MTSKVEFHVLERRTTRLVARLEAANDWFPQGISEVVSHTDEHYIAVNVSRTNRGRASVLMREFRCVDPAECRAELRAWLEALAAESEPHSASVRAWSERIADTIVASMG